MCSCGFKKLAQAVFSKGIKPKMALTATGWHGDKFLWFCSQCCNAFILVCALILMSQGWLCLSCFVTVAWCEFIFGSNKFRTHVYVMYPMHCVLKMIV